MPRKLYDCMKCPGYCCSYPVIEVKDRDAIRIAKHFGLPLKAAEQKFFKSGHGYKRMMRRKKDKYFGKTCQFFDIEARPVSCRVFPGGGRCGYWDFLKFERDAQKDQDYISTTDHSGN